MRASINSQRVDFPVHYPNLTFTNTRKQSMNLITTLSTAFTLTAVAALSSAALADTVKADEHHKAAATNGASASATATDAASAAKAMPAADADMTNAEVRKVDKDAKKITLKHEAIKSLDMPGMTMVFQVRDPALLDKAQAGDKVRVKIIQEGNAYVVTAIQPNK